MNPIPQSPATAFSEAACCTTGSHTFARLAARLRAMLSALVRLGQALLLAACLLPLAQAATLADRSILAQGVWWNPARSGSGFEILTVGDHIAVLWYTFDPSGRPTWYLAQGTTATVGADWPLQSHRWVNGKHGDPVNEGSLRLNILHPESAEITWQVGTATGKWPIQPLVLAGVINEVDRSGAWSSLTQSGWGLSLMEQGDITAAGLYAYDTDGKPVWFSGGGRKQASVQLNRYSGACPACALTQTTYAPAGQLDFNYASETRLTLSASGLPALAEGLSIAQAALAQISRPASQRSADRQLVPFPSEALLKPQLDAGMSNIIPSAHIVFSAQPVDAASTPAFSTTNTQEAGVDEADLLKTDGTTLYTYQHDADGKRLPIIRVARFDNNGVSVSGQLSIAADVNGMVKAGMYLGAGRLTSVSSTQPQSTPFALWSTAYNWRSGTTYIETFDTSTSGQPASLWKAQINGHLISSRRIGNRLIVVTRHVPTIANFSYGATAAAQVEANRILLDSTPLSALLPGIRENGGIQRPLVSAQSVWVPPQGARKLTADMVAVTVIDLSTPGVSESLAILGTIDTIYASPTSLVLAGSRYNFLGPPPPTLLEPALYLTDLHQIRIDEPTLRIVGSASVEGYIDNQGENAPFRISEQNGRVRIVTSSSNMWGAINRNRLTVLAPSTITPGLLKTVSFIPNDNRPAPIGKPGEVLYGTRFVEDRLYAVTFRRVDPLYVIDLSNDADPKIAGELEVLGYSEYLHPLPNGLLLGFGRDALPAATPGDGPFAWFQGLQFSLFDASDMSKPRELNRIVIGKRGSTSALSSTHLAFSSLRNADGSLSIGIPASVHDSPLMNSSVNLNYPWSHSGLLRFTVRGNGPTDARLDQEATLVTHSAAHGNTRPNDIYGYGNTPRSVLFPGGAVYVDSGRFWFRNTAGQVSGPF